MAGPQQIHIGLERYGLDRLIEIVESRPRLELDPEVEARIAAGASFVRDELAGGRYIYGVNSGFGSLCETAVPPEDLDRLQLNHLLSHACGVGELVAERTSRLMMLIKLLTFRGGHTGISTVPVRRMLDLWNHDAIPAVPKKGTVGASGDLAPLAHLALPLVGRGKIHWQGRIAGAAEVLQELGWQAIALAPKEGLALTNGVQYINAIAAACLVDIAELVGCADLIAALSIQGFSAAAAFYHPLYHQTSLHQERRAVAANLERLLDGSNHWQLPTCNRSCQDPYSVRCIPQVHGAVRQAVGFAWKVIEDECNGVSDNPLFFPHEGQVLFGGNLHGESTALALDFLAIAVSELGSISERRTYQLLSGQRGLPDFLVRRPGLNSGFMIAQYTSAALVNETKVLATPASVDTIPTCQLQEDHVSMGGTSAYKLMQIVENCELILAIEMLIAAQAMEMNPGLAVSPATAPVLAELRAEVAFLDEDRELHLDIEASRALLRRRRRAWVRHHLLA
ncbi:MAG TPA: aromatic amino acid ammonia-lyase [Thermoanaerobaculia bacterium]